MRHPVRARRCRRRARRALGQRPLRAPASRARRSSAPPPTTTTAGTRSTTSRSSTARPAARPISLEVPSPMTIAAYAGGVEALYDARSVRRSAREHALVGALRRALGPAGGRAQRLAGGPRDGRSSRSAAGARRRSSCGASGACAASSSRACGTATTCSRRSTCSRCSSASSTSITPPTCALRSCRSRRRCATPISGREHGRSRPSRRSAAASTSRSPPPCSLRAWSGSRRFRSAADPVSIEIPIRRLARSAYASPARAAEAYHAAAVSPLRCTIVADPLPVARRPRRR